MEAPDFLGRVSRKFFERDGFCFTVSLDREDSAATFTIMFQSRYAGRSIARIALRPAGSRLAVYSPAIECGPAGFGVVKFPVAIPPRHQGKTATFQLVAEVEYPLGQGREIRLRRGRPVPAQFGCDRWPRFVNVFPQLLGKRFLGPAACAIRLRLPVDVADDVPDETAGRAEQLWSMAE